MNILDKYEYKLKLDEIETLAGEKNYAAAAQVADGINWRKVRNVNSLMLVGEIYQQTGRYEDSKELLLMAYDRSPIGKKIIYRLAEIAIEAKQFEEAQEYYDEFVEIAPHDTLKYLLRYRMSQAKGEPLQAQIDILSELKEQEYTEEWAFELAYLYHQAGMTDKCIEACDELILWFGDGPYVEKALELKMLYQPLSGDQENKYRELRKKRDGIIEVHPDEYLESGEIINNTIKIPPIEVNADRYNTQNLQEELARGIQQIMDATEKETVNDTMDTIKKMVEEIPYLQPLLAEEQPSEPMTLPPDYETDEEIDGSLNLNFQEILEEEFDGQISLALPDGTIPEQQVRGQMTIEDVLAEWEKTKRAAEAAMEDANQRKLESAKARALQEAGDLMDRLTAVMPQLDAGATTRELVEQAYEDATPESVERASQALADANERIQEEIERLQAEGQTADEPTADASEQEQPVSDEELTGDAPTTGGMDEIDAALAAELAAEGLELYTDETDKPQAGAQPQQSGIRRELQQPGREGVTTTFPNLSEILSGSTFHSEQPDILQPEQSEADSADVQEPDTEPEDGEEQFDRLLSDWETMKDPTTPLPEISMDLFDEPQDAAAPDAVQPYQEIKKLDAEQTKRFSYFAKVDGMEAQICRVLNGCSAYLNGQLPNGNLVIEGASGCGKTMLATNIVKTLQQKIKKPSKQIGKINGDALNHKDVPALLDKISGGCLIVERVGELSRETEGKLNAYLDQHEGELLVILEDTKDHIAKALGRHEGFAAKFAQRITIPYFTNDELVEFAKTYAAENGYGIDAMAILALYRRISSIQKLDQATTLVEVKEIVDEAIDHVERGGLKKVFGILTAKRYDENNYVVLHEKDFGE